MIAMFRPMVNTLILCNDVHTRVHTRRVVQRVGVELYRAVTPRSWQGHLKVTAKSNQHKSVE